MNIQTALEKKIDQKRKEISDLEEKINMLHSEKSIKEGEITGLNEALKLLPKETTESSFRKDVESMRKDSTVADAYEVLYNLKKASHVDDILEAMGGGSKDDKHALASQLNYNSKNNRIFRKTAPNTFELLMWTVPPSSSEIDKPSINESEEREFSLPEDFDSDDEVSFI